MTKNQLQQGIIIGSFITFSMSLMDKEQQIKGSSIALRDSILRITTTRGNELMVKSANLAWQMTIDEHVDETLSFSIATLVESLAFDYIDVFKILYGSEIMNLVDRFVSKQSIGNISEYAKDSYRIADSLRDNCRKAVFTLSQS